MKLLVPYLMWSDVKHLKIGQYIGVGRRARSCLYCDQCMGGHHNPCLKGRTSSLGDMEDMRIKFAARQHLLFHCRLMRILGQLALYSVVGLPFSIQSSKIILEGQIMVAVVGIGGLCHMALQFLNSRGCEITVFSANSEKEKDARKLRAHNFLNSRDPAAIKSATNSFDLVPGTANADLDWTAYLNSLKPGGKLHIVGATPPVKTDVFAPIASERSTGGSPTGSPITIRMMLEFYDRHKISPPVEEFPLSRVN